MNEIIYRPAKQSESSDIAPYIIVATSGVIEFIFHNLAPDLSPLQIVVQQVENEEALFSYRYTHVAASNGNIVGISQSYPAVQNQITEEMERNIPRERLDMLQEVLTACVEGSLYLNILAVAANFRGQGIGKQLLAVEKQKAKQQGFSSLSLLVLTKNYNAIRLYQKQNFQEVKRIEIPPHPMLPDDDMILMNCQLD